MNLESMCIETCPAPPRTLVVCDERPATRTILSGLLRAESGTEVVCVGSSAEVIRVVTTRVVDVVLIGVHGGSTTGPAVLASLLGADPLAPAVVFGGRVDAAALTGAVKGGARGFMIWDQDDAVTRPVVLTTGVPGWPPGPVDWRRRLTEREVHILQGISCGRSYGEIARAMFLSEDTVKSHARRLFEKIGARDRAHAVAVGLRAGVLA